MAAVQVYKACELPCLHPRMKARAGVCVSDEIWVVSENRFQRDLTVVSVENCPIALACYCQVVGEEFNWQAYAELRGRLIGGRLRRVHDWGAFLQREAFSLQAGHQSFTDVLPVHLRQVTTILPQHTCTARWVSTPPPPSPRVSHSTR